MRPGTAAERFREDLEDISRACSAVFVSFDIDSIASADAPGVSATGVCGLTAREALDMCMIAGAHDKVAMLDISEFNPDVECARTAKLVTAMIYYFLMGAARRLSSGGQRRI